MGLRVDKWLWSVRVYKTRSLATEGCKSGKVRVNNDVAKPATKIAVGDVVEARLRERTIVYVVQELLEKRVGAAVAAEAYDDQSPPVAENPRWDDAISPEILLGRRDRGQGRPTKRDRREIERLRGRDS